jgi:hypothetical protein
MLAARRKCYFFAKNRYKGNREKNKRGRERVYYASVGERETFMCGYDITKVAGAFKDRIVMNT